LPFTFAFSENVRILARRSSGFLLLASFRRARMEFCAEDPMLIDSAKQRSNMKSDTFI
jgi:hypothetical protein